MINAAVSRTATARTQRACSSSERRESVPGVRELKVPLEVPEFAVEMPSKAAQSSTTLARCIFSKAREY